MAKPKPPKVLHNMGMRLTDSDVRFIAALKEKLGLKSTTELLRQGLRALAAKEGVAA